MRYLQTIYCDNFSGNLDISHQYRPKDELCRALCVLLAEEKYPQDKRFDTRQELDWTLHHPSR